MNGSVMGDKWRFIWLIVFVVWHGLGLVAESFPGRVTIDRGVTNGLVPEVCPQYYVSNENGILACPEARGLTILPAHYPPRTLFVGYSPEADYLSFLSTLIEHNARRNRPLQIIVLIPRLDTEQAYQDLKPYMQRSQANHLTFFTTPSDETLWMQDYLEIGLSLRDGRLRIVDLPYIDREGEAIPAAIALSCQYELIPQPKESKNDVQDELPQHGNYGGNVEALPGNILMLGNTMNQQTQTHLHQIFQHMKTITINVKWLETGHVDELFSVLPDRSAKATCPFAMVYTSPKLALALMQKYKFNSRHRILPNPVMAEDVSLELQDPSFFSECLSLYATNKVDGEKCKKFIQANIAYEVLIQQERRRIDAALVKNKACANINWIALPQLFVPSYNVWLEEGSWGSDEDEAQALNPNTVNMIALGEEVIVPEQLYKPFAQEVSRRLEELNLLPVRIDSALSHYLSGGLHCNTAVARVCGSR